MGHRNTKAEAGVEPAVAPREKMAEKELRQRREALQAKLGRSIQVRIETFMNWGKNQTALVLAVRPKSLSEIQRIVRAAKELHYRIRPVGHSHSWSPLFSDEGHICMYMAELQPEEGCQRLSVHKPADESQPMTVTALANTPTRDFMDFQLKHDVCILSNVTLETVHLAGLVSCGCHGAAKDEPCVSSYVTRMRVVDADGELRTFDQNDMDALHAAQVSLGLFGIIYDITLRVQPMQLINTTSEFLKAKHVLLDPVKLKERFEKNWATEIFWFPFNSMSYPQTLLVNFVKKISKGLRTRNWYPEEDGCWIRTMNKTDIPRQPLLRDEDYTFQRASTFAQDGYLRLQTENFVEKPWRVPGMLKAGYEYILKPSMHDSVVQEVTMGIHYDSWVDLSPTTGVEYIFNVDNTLEDFMVCSDACRRAMEVTHRFALRGKFPVNITMQVRWTGNSDAYLSPANTGGKAHCFYLCIVSVSGTKSWGEFVNAVAQELVKLPIKPHVHWAKQWGNLTWMNTDYLRNQYRDNIELFKKALTRTKVDPNGMFRNEILQNLIFDAPPTPDVEVEGFVFPSIPRNYPVIDGDLVDGFLGIGHDVTNGLVGQTEEEETDDDLSILDGVDSGFCVSSDDEANTSFDDRDVYPVNDAGMDDVDGFDDVDGSFNFKIKRQLTRRETQINKLWKKCSENEQAWEEACKKMAEGCLTLDKSKNIDATKAGKAIDQALTEVTQAISTRAPSLRRSATVL